MIIEALKPHHNRLAFSCGIDKLDRFLHETAHQAKRKGLAAIFVGVEEADPGSILGYYSLSSYLVEGADIPEVVRRSLKLPIHGVGATMLGRLAVAFDLQNQGIGTLLLADALKRAYKVSGNVGSVGVVVDAMTEDGVAWYEKNGFSRLDSDSMRLVIMMGTIAELLPGVDNFIEVEEAG